MENDDRKGSIYFGHCHISSKRYVGQTYQEPEDRIDQHKLADQDTEFHNAIRKHGFENFTFCWLHYKDLPRSKLNQYERYYIWLFDLQNPEKGYNMMPGGDGGFHFWQDPDKREKAIAKMVKSRSGNNHWTKKNPEAATKFKEVFQNPEIKEKIRESHKKRKKEKEERKRNRKIGHPKENQSIKDWRKTYEISIKELSQMVGMSVRIIREMECEGKIRRKQRKKWIDSTGFDPIEYFDLELFDSGNLIKDWRESQGFTHDSLAQKLGISESSVCRIQSSYRFSSKVRRKWIDIFGFDPVEKFNLNINSKKDLINDDIKIKD